jgi:predicted RNase H-like nuclease (RuvC/YqgF family)
MLRNGNVELSAREEEIRFLKMELANEERKIALLRKSLPNKRQIEQELVTLQIEVRHCMSVPQLRSQLAVIGFSWWVFMVVRRGGDSIVELYAYVLHRGYSNVFLTVHESPAGQCNIPWPQWTVSHNFSGSDYGQLKAIRKILAFVMYWFWYQ